MKKFALLAMLLCAGIVTFGCAEKKPAKPADKPAAEKPAEGATETPPAEKPAP